MGLRNNYQKLKLHLGTGGLFYAFWRGAKYFVFLIKKQRARFKQMANYKYAIIKGRTKITCSDCGINIFWNDSEVTTGVGLNVAVNTLGLWTNSTKADWQILKKGEADFKLKVTFKELPISQIWRIKIKGQLEIDWQIDVDIEELLHIDEFRIICLANPRYKTWIGNYRHADFPRQDDNFRDLFLDEGPVSLVGARFPVEGEFLPSFTLEVQDGNLLPLIQNTPRSSNSHIIGFRLIDFKEKRGCHPGYYSLFAGTINLFEKDYLLDSKIESLRQDSLETAFKTGPGERTVRRKLKVLLANLPWQRDGTWGVRAGSRWPHIKDASENDYLPFPFFLTYATSLLQKHNIDASVVDAIAEQISEDKFLEKVSKMNLDYLVAETSIPSFYDDLAILKKISSTRIPIILCGPNSEIFQRQFLKNHPFIDFVLCGEYEFTLLDLLRSLQRDKDLSRVKGLIYRENGEIIENLKREPFNINLLPWPHRDGLPMDKYLDAPGEMFTPCVQMLASRGCPFKCQFCLWPQVIYQGNRYRVRDVNDVVDEMEYLVREKGFKSVYFDDDTFNIGKKRMLDFCREIKRRGLDEIQWAIMARPDLMDEEILEEMKKAGLWAVKYGLESATQSLVDNIEKNMDLKKAEKMIRFTQNLGIKTHLTFTFGLPGETSQTIEKTIKYAQRLRPFSAQFSIMTPFPGTKFYEVLEKKGSIVSKDLSLYDGHFKSVIKLQNLAPQDLEIAKEKACRIWVDHLRKRRGLWGNVKRFYYYAKNKGLGYSVAKTISYFRYTFLKRRRYLRSEDLKEVISSNSADIVLIQCPPWDISIPPLGIAYLSSYLSKSGFKASVVDLNAALYNSAKEDAKYLWEQKSYDWWVNDDLFKKTWAQLRGIAAASIDEILKRVDAKNIGLSVNFAGIHFGIELLKIIKCTNNGAKIILGGWGCINGHMRSLFPKELVDVFVVGEGEETLKEVMEALRENREAKDVPGAIFNKDGQSVYKPRPAIVNLDSIPWPTFREFPLDQYTSGALPLFTSRGCVGKCSFCNDWTISRPYRFRSAQNIFEEIKYHVEKSHIHTFTFKDLLCNGNIAELNLLSDLIINSGLKINWDSQATPRKVMTYELLCKLKKAGCGTLIYGVESFSNNVLRRMRKLFTKETAERVIRDTYKAGIMTIINIIVGFPGETEKDFQETIEAIKRNRKYISQIGAVSVCLVNNDSDLDLNPESYDLILPLDPKIRAKKWVSVDGENTYDMRNARAQKILELINQLGLSYETKTI